MHLFIDLNKSELNTPKLVKKPVQVRGKNGKVFTRMQWVNPRDASTGMGIRKISTKEGLKRAIRDGIDKHPGFHQAMKDQGVHPDTFEDHHPHFFVPETKESHDNRVHRMLQFSGNVSDMINAGKHEHTIEHNAYIPKHVHQVYGKHHFIPSETRGYDHEKFLRSNNIHPEIYSIIKGEILNIDTEDNSPRDNLDQITINLKSHKSTIHRHVSEHIKSTTKDTFVRNVQLSALREGDMHPIAVHPHIAKESVNKILGNHLADKFRKDLDNSNLSVNFYNENLGSIQRDGYIASTLEGYVENQLGEEALQKLDGLINDHYFDSEKERLDALRNISDDYGWSDIYARAKAEYDSIGLHLDDRKPTYIAFNSNNKPSGAATYYGNRWLKVTDVDNVLNHSTATMDDSFEVSDSIAKIFSMDHLKDMFILKMIQTNPHMGNIIKHGEDEDAYGGWNWKTGTIPIELQYHQPSLKPDQFKIMSNEPDEDKPSPVYNGLDSQNTPDQEGSTLTNLGDLDLDDDLDLNDFLEDDLEDD